MDTLIIGGGVAGITAAIAAAERGERVTVLERNRKPLKKLCVTGNGRGNLLNSGTPLYYGDSAFALEVLTHMPYASIYQFLQEIGITLMQEDEGRVYPAAMLASVAAEALLLRAAQLGVRILPNTRAVQAHKRDGRFDVQAVESVYLQDTMKASGKAKKGELVREQAVTFGSERLIVTIGGAAAPAHGTDGTAYKLLCSFGHKLTPLHPALCALVTEEAPIAGLAGLRVRARLSLVGANGKGLHESTGEALFAQDGVSGIAAMQLARFVTKDCQLQLDLRPAIMGSWCTKESAQPSAHNWLEERLAGMSAQDEHQAQGFRELFTGATTPALAHALLRMAEGIGRAGSTSAWRGADSMNHASLAQLATAIEHFTLKVLGTRGMEAAQVTAGGIQASDFDSVTLQSKLVDGLYAAGEALDVDGDCGGFNLMFAFASGLLAGGRRCCAFSAHPAGQC